MARLLPQPRLHCKYAREVIVRRQSGQDRKNAYHPFRRTIRLVCARRHEAESGRAAAAERLEPVLIVVGAAHEGGRAPVDPVIPVEGALVLGRLDGDESRAGHALLADRAISSRHARVHASGGEAEVFDLESTNGTFVDGQRVDGSAPLPDGARLFIGGHALVFRWVTERERTAITAEQRACFGPVPSASPALAAVCERLRKVARREDELLLVGESGTGKEVYARAVHQASGRRGGFVTINCAARPRERLAGELFGYATADCGTALLDEMGEMPPALQATWLRFLQERVLTPAGAIAPVTIDVRVLVAARPDTLDKLRPDLRARLGPEPICLPALRDRVEDIGRLTRHFLGSKPLRLSANALRALCLYPWPLNVRELQTTIETAARLTGDTGEIDVDHLPVVIRAATGISRTEAIPVVSSAATTTPRNRKRRRHGKHG